MISIIMTTCLIPSPFDRVADNHRRALRLAAGEALFLQGDRTRGLFYLADGQVELVRHLESGHRLTVHRANGGESFAEASLFADTYHCDARATSACVGVQLNRHAVLRLMESDPAFARALTKRFAHQIQIYRRRLELVSIKGAQERTFAAICDGMLSGTVLQLANDIGLSHEAVYRALTQLVRAKRLQKSGRGSYVVG